eukprot:m.222041 g.222041  ORF g.222041 m.222041 type:complete len:82 (+) comp15620_c1_seq5:1997-2242(+)
MIPNACYEFSESRRVQTRAHNSVQSTFSFSSSLVSPLPSKIARTGSCTQHSFINPTTYLSAQSTFRFYKFNTTYLSVMLRS